MNLCIVRAIITPRSRASGVETDRGNQQADHGYCRQPDVNKALPILLSVWSIMQIPDAFRSTPTEKFVIFCQKHVLALHLAGDPVPGGERY